MDLTIHVYHHFDASAIESKLDQILIAVAGIARQESQIMSKEADLQTDLDAIKTGVATLLTAAIANAATIADLKAQLAAGTPVSQDQLDALEAEAKAIVASLTPMGGMSAGKKSAKN